MSLFNTSFNNQEDEKPAMFGGFFDDNIPAFGSNPDGHFFADTNSDQNEMDQEVLNNLNDSYDLPMNLHNPNQTKDSESQQSIISDPSEKSTEKSLDIPSEISQYHNQISSNDNLVKDPETTHLNSKLLSLMRKITSNTASKISKLSKKSVESKKFNHFIILEASKTAILILQKIFSKKIEPHKVTFLENISNQKPDQKNTTDLTNPFAQIDYNLLTKKSEFLLMNTKIH